MHDQTVFGYIHSFMYAGGCGSGPNMILMPGTVPLRHISTPAKVTDVIRRLCALDVPESLLKASFNALHAPACR